MATYKVIQDIEAEDKLVGPLTLRQFIYAGVAVVLCYISFSAYTRGAGFLMVIFLPVAAIAVFFAFPWKREQPTEIWALARIRFSIKPRVRIWDQDGAKDLVTITVPKKLKDSRPQTVLSQSEVRSRLKALANTIDSRGWATRNAAYGIYGQQWAHPTVAAPIPGGAIAAIPNADDMFDASSTVSQNFDAMLNKSSEQQRQRVLQQIAQAGDPAAYRQVQPMANTLPNIPTPNASSAYDVAPAPAPLPTQPQAMQSNYPASTMPMLPPPQYSQPPQAFAQAAATDNPNYWFANGPAYPVNPQPAAQVQPQYAAVQAPTLTPPPSAPVGYTTGGGGTIESDVPYATAATPTDDELAMSDVIRQQNQTAMAVNYGHMRVLQPLSGPGTPGSSDANSPYSTPDPAAMAMQPAPASAAQTAEPVTRQPDPAILELANNDDLDIATIARQANREINKSPDEVEIRLH